MSEKYDEYLNKHISNVGKACTWLKENGIGADIFGDEYFNIMINAEYNSKFAHDFSKYNDSEYPAYDNYFYGEKTDKVKSEFDYAWLHHIHNNPHHWQYWILYEDEGETKALEMPPEYIFEMISDWWSFSFAKDNLDEIFDWYEEHKDKMVLHKNTRKIVESILKEIKDKLHPNPNNGKD